MKQSEKFNRGFAYILALLLLAIFSTLAVAFASSTDLGLQKSNNCTRINKARMAAESGLAFHTYVLSQIVPSDENVGEDLVLDIAEKLAAKLNGTFNLDGAAVIYSEGTLTITIPGIMVNSDSGTFSAQVSLDGEDENKIWLEVTGYAGAARRTVRMAFETERDDSVEFKYGLATRGKVILSGQTSILSANDGSSEASMFSSYVDATEDTFTLTGQVEIDGEIFTSDPDAGVSVESNGKISIAGEIVLDPSESDHIHKGMGTPVFPEPNVAMFEPFVAENTMALANPPTATYTNIRIPANTNPTFAADCVLKGVTFIEQPNSVNFEGKVTIQGVIVTEDARESDDENTITFSGQVDSLPLPDTPEFQELREISGIFLMAPGFDVEFSGQFGTVNGAMVADSFTFSGQAGGIVQGPIISYGDTPFEYSGQTGLTIDRSGGSQLPPCFWVSSPMKPLPETYAEN
ncbi:MAG: hypothetical protein KAV00_10845 [Phycisphaerae bacterium]|nr:hypothetical protein [Phycisphaerae bacterium]